MEAPGGGGGTPPTESFRAWGFWHHSLANCKDGRVNVQWMRKSGTMTFGYTCMLYFLSIPDSWKALGRLLSFPSFQREGTTSWTLIQKIFLRVVKPLDSLVMSPTSLVYFNWCRSNTSCILKKSEKWQKQNKDMLAQQHRIPQNKAMTRTVKLYFLAKHQIGL